MTIESSVPHPLVVGRYVLEREIGSGGMGSVYFGRMVGPAGFSRVVAIKRLHPQYSKDGTFATALIDEARLAARIAHANVVQVLDVVVHGGELLLVMELLHGETLARLITLSAGPVPVEIAGKVALDVLSGLHAAHEVRDESGTLIELVHRDVSPQNVIVGTDGVSRLIDFGVAKAIGRMQQTTDGRLKGKIGYFAPETIRDGQVDRRVDIYAAGVMLWETLTGTPLFRGQNELQVMSAILSGAVKPPSSLVSGLAPALDAVVMKAMARDPDARFATAEDMADALDAALVPARSRRVGEWVRRTAEQTLNKREQALSELAGTAIAGYSALTKAAENSGIVATPQLHRPDPSSPTTPFLAAADSNAVPTQKTDPDDDEKPTLNTELKGTMPSAVVAPADSAVPTLVQPTFPATPAAVAVAPTLPVWPEPLPPEPVWRPSQPAHAPEPTPRWIAPAALGLILLVGAAAYVTYRANLFGRTETIVAPTAPPAAIAPPSPSPIETVVLQPIPEPSAAPIPSAAPTPSTPRTERKPTTKPRTAPHAAPDCSKPYTVNERGIRIYKPECVASPSK